MEATEQEIDWHEYVTYLSNVNWNRSVNWEDESTYPPPIMKIYLDNKIQYCCCKQWWASKAECFDSYSNCASRSYCKGAMYKEGSIGILDIQ